MIIGLTGTHGAGKGTIARHLRKRFPVLRMSDVFRAACDARSIPQTRENLIAVSAELVKRHGKEYAAVQIMKKITGDAVVDGIRRPEEVDYFRKYGLVLIGVDADIRVRYARVTKRHDTTDQLSFESFSRLEEEEMHDAQNMQIRQCMERADIVLSNDGSEEELLRQIDDFLMGVID